MTLDEIFNAKLTENGDLAFTKVNDNALLNILFLTEYYQNHITELPELDDTPINKLFAMFIRDGIVYMRSDDNSWFWQKRNDTPLELNTIAKLDVFTHDSGRRCLVTFSGKDRHEKTEEYLLEIEKVRV